MFQLHLDEIDKEDVVHIYNKILLSQKKNKSWPFLRNWIHLDSIMLVK